MMMDEFNEQIDAYNMEVKRPTPAEYKILEYVYTFHPSNMSKRQAAILWCEFGISIFKEMEQLAKRWEAVNERIREHKYAIEDLERDKETLKEIYTCVE